MSMYVNHWFVVAALDGETSVLVIVPAELSVCPMLLVLKKKVALPEAGADGVDELVVPVAANDPELVVDRFLRQVFVAEQNQSSRLVVSRYQLVPAVQLAEGAPAPLVRLILPLPAGAAHVPSPRQKVEELALVPLLRLATGRLPVTPVLSGRPVPLVRTTADGVPRAGVTRVGEVLSTTLPLPLVLKLVPQAVPVLFGMPAPG